MIEVSLAGAASVDALEPLCRSLFATMEENDSAPVVPYLDLDSMWQSRRACYIEWLATDGSFAVLAHDDADLVGYAIVEVVDSDGDFDLGERVAEMQSLSVAADRRREGIGAKLVERARGELRDHGVRSMIVGVLASNDAAIAFYERMGLRSWARQYVDLFGDEGRDHA